MERDNYSIYQDSPLFLNGVNSIKVEFHGKRNLSAVLDRKVCESIVELQELSARTKRTYRADEISPTTRGDKLTAEHLLHSSLVGLWSERKDIADNPDFARKLRDRAQFRDK
jgi:hypothetical protein